jgi:hypothetical protein
MEFARTWPECEALGFLYQRSRVLIPPSFSSSPSRSLGEDEALLTTLPTRTVLVSGLDQNLTVPELRQNLDQCGQVVVSGVNICSSTFSTFLPCIGISHYRILIVDPEPHTSISKSKMDVQYWLWFLFQIQDLEIRRGGGSPYGICEYVDITSASRAHWGRFMLKYSRVSFYRTPPSNAILIDGAAGFSEKLVTGQCCQYGAISKIVVDIVRSMVLVTFEEVSSIFQFLSSQA